MSMEQETPKAEEGAAAQGDAPSGGSQPGATVDYKQAYKPQQSSLETVTRERDALKGQRDALNGQVDLRAEVADLKELVKMAVLSGGGMMPADTGDGEEPSPAAKALADYQAKQVQRQEVQRAVSFTQQEMKERLEDAGFTPETLPAYAGLVADMEREMLANPGAANSAFEKAKKALRAEVKKQQEDAAKPSTEGLGPEIRTQTRPGGSKRTWKDAQKVTKLSDLGDEEYNRHISEG